MNKLTEQQKHFIELVAGQMFDSSMTAESIAQEVGISRKTVFNWKKKFSREIGKASAENLGHLKPQLYSVTAELLGSSKATERVKGAELMMKLEDREQLEASAMTKAQELEKVASVVKTMMEVLKIENKEDVEMFGKLILSSAIDLSYERPDKYEAYRNLTVNEMLESLSI